MKSVAEGLPNSRGPRPNRWIYIPRQECGRSLKCYFIRCDFVSKYYKTVGCNFWQPQGSHFAAKFVIGTPPETKGVFDAVRNSRWHGPNRWNTYLDRHLEKELISIFFWPEFVFKCHYTVRCNFWQPQGSHFTANFGIGTPPHLKGVSDALPDCRGPRPNRCRAYLGRNVGRELIFVFFWARVGLRIP